MAPADRPQYPSRREIRCGSAARHTHAEASSREQVGQTCHEVGRSGILDEDDDVGLRRGGRHADWLPPPTARAVRSADMADWRIASMTSADCQADAPELSRLSSPRSAAAKLS